MLEAVSFFPDRQFGTVVHALLLPVPILVGGYAFARALDATFGLAFFVYLAVLLLCALLLPWLAYHLYALRRSVYVMDREGIQIQWGLRLEDIPMPAILWVRTPSDLGRKIPLPVQRLPGALLGVRRSADLGVIEFMASDARNLILIATNQRVYAISPAEPERFLRELQALIELGSIAPLPALSIRPTLLVTRVWHDQPARLLFFADLLLGIGVILLAGFLIPAREGTSAPNLTVSLVLLALVNSVFILADWVLGVFFFRRTETRSLAYILWVTAAGTSILLLSALALL